MAILASGPSLSEADIERCRRAHQAAQGRQGAQFRVIAVNDSYTVAPWADMLYFADYRWWSWHKDREAFKSFAGVKVSIANDGRVLQQDDIHVLQNLGSTGLSDKPNGLHTGNNSTHQALNIAVLAGAQNVLLLGVDMKVGNDGKEHFFGSHPIRTEPAYFSTMIRSFGKTVKPLAKLGVQVINCSPGSALDCFAKEPLDVALARLEHDPGATLLPA